MPYTVMYANYLLIKLETICEIHQVCRKECLKQIYNLINCYNKHSCNLQNLSHVSPLCQNILSFMIITNDGYRDYQ